MRRRSRLYPVAIQQSVTNGVHTIEHGNLLDEATARLMIDAGAVLVPTPVTYYTMKERGAEFGLPKVNRDKNATILDAGLETVEIAHRLGVTMGLGTDLLGETQPMQAGELAIHREVEPAEAILRSLWITNARLCRLEGHVGLIAPGAFGDVVVSRVDPTADIVAFADVDASLPRDPGRPGHRRTVTEFRSIIWFKVRPGAETAFESAFDDAGMLTRPIQVDGFGGAELLLSTTSPDKYYVLGTWSSPAGYARWQAISTTAHRPKRWPTRRFHRRASARGRGRSAGRATP